MNRLFSVFLTVAILLSALCWNASPGSAENPAALNIVTTIFPEYDWVREILGEKFSDANVTMLLDKGVDLHSYQPTVDDMVKIASCDLFIYVGGESDRWVDAALKQAGNGSRKVINLLEVLGAGAKPEEIVEGMQEADREEEEEDAHDHEAEMDEHVWLSLKNAQVLCSAISDALQQLDSQNRDIYAANTAAYLQRLAQLDEQFRQTVDNGTFKTLLFGDRFPFRYLADDYGLRYYAAFSGCSAESEASFETVFFLATKMDELELPCILTIEGTHHRIAQTIVENTALKNQKILTLDSMQAITAQDVAGGATYLSLMEKNLDVLAEALG